MRRWFVIALSLRAADSFGNANVAGMFSRSAVLVLDLVAFSAPFV